MITYKNNKELVNGKFCVLQNFDQLRSQEGIERIPGFAGFLLKI